MYRITSTLPILFVIELLNSIWTDELYQITFNITCVVEYQVGEVITFFAESLLTRTFHDVVYPYPITHRKRLTYLRPLVISALVVLSYPRDAKHCLCSTREGCSGSRSGSRGRTCHMRGLSLHHSWGSKRMCAGDIGGTPISLCLSVCACLPWMQDRLHDLFLSFFEYFL